MATSKIPYSQFMYKLGTTLSNIDPGVCPGYASNDKASIFVTVTLPMYIPANTTLNVTSVSKINPRIVNTIEGWGSSTALDLSVYDITVIRHNHSFITNHVDFIIKRKDGATLNNCPQYTGFSTLIIFDATVVAQS